MIRLKQVFMIGSELVLYVEGKRHIVKGRRFSLSIELNSLIGNRVEPVTSCSRRFLFD